jgi:hypothetical protein
MKGDKLTSERHKADSLLLSTAVAELITGDIPLYTYLIPKSGWPRHFFSHQ